MSPNTGHSASMHHLRQDALLKIHTFGLHCTPSESKSLDGSQHLPVILRPLKFENRLNRGLKHFYPH